MKSKGIYTAAILMILIAMGCLGNKPDEKASGLIASVLKQESDLTGERSPETEYYFIETKIVHFALDGKRTGVDAYKLQLDCIPANLSGKEGDEYNWWKDADPGIAEIENARRRLARLKGQ